MTLPIPIPIPIHQQGLIPMNIYYSHLTVYEKYVNNSLHLARKYARMDLSADIICSEKRTVFLECSLRLEENCVTDNGQGQYKEGKYPSIFSPQEEAIVFMVNE